MTGADRRVDGEEQPTDRTPEAATAPERAEAAGRATEDTPEGASDEAPGPEAEAADLIAQIRELAGPDPVAVRTVVAEVLAALDRVSGGTLREQLPYESERVTEPDARMPELDEEPYPTDPAPERNGKGNGNGNGNGGDLVRNGSSAGDPYAAGLATGSSRSNGSAPPRADGLPVEPHPVTPTPPEPHPAQPQPGQPQPGRPGPADPHPAGPAPGDPSPASPRPTDPHPVDPHPADPHPGEPGPVTPGPIERRSAQCDGEDRT
ncbi:hypothetical protein I0C86_06370 [Plantactinospora sp. S1510]|uniref:Uncharacterized protein n=1 Tax=Plantactinospora alkalitolerans TaxID=2789879 RepID=A0ABS0GQY5_9ACTN|nr:hypothetical protein [Plantactinospora alkalitolerans]MBF9128614.1 hypothetical protein [Plantactinospora alkalitolerans]